MAPAVVIDNGTGYTKLGEHTPRALPLPPPYPARFHSRVRPRRRLRVERGAVVHHSVGDWHERCQVLGTEGVEGRGGHGLLDRRRGRLPVQRVHRQLPHPPRHRRELGQHGALLAEVHLQVHEMRSGRARLLAHGAADVPPRSRRPSAPPLAAFDAPRALAPSRAGTLPRTANSRQRSCSRRST